MVINVIKIGGAAISSKKGILNLIEILRNNKEKSILVVSAFGKTTRRLAECAVLAESALIDDALLRLTSIIGYHENILKDIEFNNKSLNSRVKSIENELENILQSIEVTGELTSRTLDKVMSYGETLALEILSAVLKGSNLSIGLIDSREYLITDDKHTKASPNIDETKKNITAKIIPLFDKHNLVITQGFVAATQSGATTTMGIESSNLTASLLAELLYSKNILIYTDVPGIRSIDPKIFSGHAPINKLSYKEAIEASRHGVKLIYPQMIEHAHKTKKTIIYRSLLDPKHDETIIGDFANNSLKPIINIEHDSYYTEIEFSNNFELIESSSEIIKAGKGFISGINISAGKLKLICWEKFKIGMQSFDFEKKSSAKIIFIPSDKMQESIQAATNSGVDEILADIETGKISITGKKDSVERSAIAIHKILH